MINYERSKIWYSRILELFLDILKLCVRYPNIWSGTSVLSLKSQSLCDTVSLNKTLLTLRGPPDTNDNKVICLPNRLEVLCDTDAEGDASRWHTDHPGDLGAHVWVHPISAIFKHISKTNCRGKWIIGESRGQTETTIEPHPPLPPPPWATQRWGWPLEEQFVTCQLLACEIMTALKWQHWPSTTSSRWFLIREAKKWPLE